MRLNFKLHSEPTVTVSNVPERGELLTQQMRDACGACRPRDYVPTDPHRVRKRARRRDMEHKKAVMSNKGLLIILANNFL